jgi:hypothetical protein
MHTILDKKIKTLFWADVSKYFKCLNLLQQVHQWITIGKQRAYDQMTFWITVRNAVTTMCVRFLHHSQQFCKNFTNCMSWIDVVNYFSSQ